MRAIFPFLLAGLASSFGSPAAAERVPAGFGAGEDSLHTLIEFPELKGDSDHTIVCAAVVRDSGKPEQDQSGCYVVQPGDEIYVAAVGKALRKARFTPASIDGRTVDVYLQFRVRFRQAGEEREIMLYPNPGYPENVQYYGDDHVAAQRSIGREDWMKACPQHSRFTVIAKAHISFEGIPSAISIGDGSGLPITEKCRAGILRTLEQSLYTPAMDDGETVPSTYIEPFGN